MFPYQYGQTSQNQLAYEQSLKNIINQANGQLQQLQNQPVQYPQSPTNLTQNFQLAPNSNNSELESKYANTIEEVKNTFVIKTGIFATKDFSTIWVKNVSGDIRTFRTEEVFEMDEKDKEIFMLKKQLEEMKGMILNATKSVDANANEEITESKSDGVSNRKRSTTK